LTTGYRKLEAQFHQKNKGRVNKMILYHRKQACVNVAHTMKFGLVKINYQYGR